MTLRILNILTELCSDWRIKRLATVDYLAEYSIDINKVSGFCGSLTVTPITLLPNRRFDLPDHGADAVEGCIIEALGADGESVIDLCAWPTADPTDVRTLLGRAPIVGLWAALNPGTYTFGYPLVMHRSPLAWLQSDCEGAAILNPDTAVMTILKIRNMGGLIGAQDPALGCELQEMLQALVDQVEIVIPKTRVGV